MLSIESWDEVRKKSHIDNVTNKMALSEILKKMGTGETEYRIYTLRKICSVPVTLNTSVSENHNQRRHFGFIALLCLS